MAKLVIEKERIFTENSSRSHGYGALRLSSFEPFPKNPAISKVFREIGLADELGSGMRNTYKYTRLYSGAEPEFWEGDIFRTTIPLNRAATIMVGPTTQAGTEADTEADTQVRLSDDKLAALIEFCSIPRSRKEMQEFCSIKTAECFRKHIIKPMIQNNMIRRTIPEKPNSGKQKYIRV